MKTLRINALPLTLALLAVFAISAIGQATATKTQVSGPASSKLGSYEGRNYSNTFFGFTLKLPDEGVIVGQEEGKIYKNAGADLLKSDNRQANKSIEDEMAKELTLVNYANKTLGLPDNTILIIAAQKQPSTAVTVNMVMAATVKTLVATGKYEIVKTLTSPKIGGRPAAGFEGRMTVGDHVINSKLYIIMINGYSLQFGITYFSNEGLKKGEDILAGLKFTPR